MKTKHLTEEEIAIYADALNQGELESVPKHIRQHIKECDQCAEEVVAVEETLAQFNRANTNKNSRSIKRSAVFWVPVAAGLTILIGIGGYFFFYNHSQDQGVPSDGMIAETDTVEVTYQPQEKQPKQDTFQVEEQEPEQENKPVQQKPLPQQTPEKKQIAEAFQPNQRLEALSGRFSGEAMRGDNLEINENNTIRQKPDIPITLNWYNPEELSVTVEILDNKGHRIMEKNTVADSVTFESGLSEGLYYWKLFNKHFDLLHCGKIRIEKD